MSGWHLVEGTAAGREHHAVAVPVFILRSATIVPPPEIPPAALACRSTDAPSHTSSPKTRSWVGETLYAVDTRLGIDPLASSASTDVVA